MTFSADPFLQKSPLLTNVDCTMDFCSLFVKCWFHVDGITQIIDFPCFEQLGSEEPCRSSGYPKVCLLCAMGSHPTENMSFRVNATQLYKNHFGRQARKGTQKTIVLTWKICVLHDRDNILRSEFAFYVDKIGKTPKPRLQKTVWFTRMNHVCCLRIHFYRDHCFSEMLIYFGLRHNLCEI